MSEAVGTGARGHGGTDAPERRAAGTARAEAYRPVFDEGGEGRRRLEEVLSRFPTRAAALVPALWMVQRQHGWIPLEGMAEVAEALGLTPAYVKGVVTFYSMFHRRPVGRNVAAVCTTSPCNLRGAERVAEAFLRATGAKRLGETSPDGEWTVVETECLGACGFATPVLINDDLIESVSPETVPALLERYR